MPQPFISTSVYAPITVVLLEDVGGETKVFKCPGDTDSVFTLCGSSYTYNNSLAGETLDENFLARRLNFSPTEIPVSYDCDGDTFTLQDGTITVQAFHALRNLLFADGHVGNYSQ